MIFGFIEDSIENGLDVFDALLDGEAPSKKQLAKMIADGVEIAAIATATGYGIEVLQNILDD